MKNSLIRNIAISLMANSQAVIRNRVISHAVKGCKVVGDFGCGQYPNKYANVFVDKLEERGIYVRPFARRDVFGETLGRLYNIDLNVYPWPWTEKHFDFVILSGVLEHLINPVRVCRELSRVAKAGYIEVPHGCSDIFIRNLDPYHKWLCYWDAVNNTLGFADRDKCKKQYAPFHLPVAMRLLLQLQPIRIFWRDKIKGTTI